MTNHELNTTARQVLGELHRMLSAATAEDARNLRVATGKVEAVLTRTSALAATAELDPRCRASLAKLGITNPVSMAGVTTEAEARERIAAAKVSS